MKHMTTPLNAPLPRADLPAYGADVRGYYTVSQAAALLGVSRVSIWRWISTGRIPASRLGHRTVRIQRQDLEQVLVQIAPGKSTPRSDWRDMRDPEHFVQFYEADDFLLDAVRGFMGTALRAGDSGILVATGAHRQRLEERLQAHGLDLADARASGRYVSLDAAETLSRFMVDEAPDPERFSEVLGGIIARAAEGGRRVRMFGEMVALLWAQGNQVGALRLEELWNDLARTHSFSLFCAYPMDELVGEAHTERLTEICSEHSRLIPAESYTSLPSSDQRLQAITVLQQRARSLEAEIAQRKQAEERLRVALESERAARQTAETALRSRDEFLSIASHELRTPLTSLSAQAQLALRRLAQDGQLEPERIGQALRLITGQSEKLSRLLTQLLDISRLEADKLTLEREWIDLTALVEQALDSARSQTALHTINLEALAPLEAEVDPLRLEQVVTNLLDNAIKYSPEGGPIEVVLSRPTPAEVMLSVRDHGLGIPPEKRGQIFERFYQAHAIGHKSGMGLGLYISRQIVELHGGKIRPEFPPDGGTRFVVRLPIALDGSAAARAAISAP
jgi:excisionase family DNA binding protein